MGMLHSASMQMLEWVRTIDSHNWQALHLSGSWPGFVDMDTRWLVTLLTKARVDTHSGLLHPLGEQREMCSNPRTTERIFSDGADAVVGAESVVEAWTEADAGRGCASVPLDTPMSPPDCGLDGSWRGRLVAAGSTNLSDPLALLL